MSPTKSSPSSKKERKKIRNAALRTPNDKKRMIKVKINVNFTKKDTIESMFIIANAPRKICAFTVMKTEASYSKQTR